MIITLLVSCFGDIPSYPGGRGLVGHDTSDTGNPSDADTDSDTDSDTDGDADTDTDTDSGETGIIDSGDSGDTAVDSGDSGDTGDTGDTGADADTDSDVDSDTDADTDSDTDTDSGVIDTGVVDTGITDTGTVIDTGTVDTGCVFATYYADSDADLYGDAATWIESCSVPSGYVEDSTDCDDTNVDIHPGAAESDCTDPVDYNCDGSTGYSDADSDGFAACADCDDSDAGVNPGATEVCDSMDNDCDGAVDEGLAVTLYSADSDADGYGNSSDTMSSCGAPSGYATDDTDCDDTDSSINPAATEVCDSVDNDCDRSIDEGVTTTYYEDSDADGYGDASVSTSACSAPAGYVASATDCDDLDPYVNPGVHEVCDEIDDDCDGSVDEGFATTTYYADSDGDGYGDSSSSYGSCMAASAGYVTGSTDCDDGTARVYPGAAEVCDSVDNDCDGSVDESVTTTYYADSDADGYGDASVSTSACSLPAGYVASATDCDDTDSSINPAATEVCDSTDNDCDGSVDEGVTTTYYADSDADGYGDSSSSLEDCSAPVGYIVDGADCDDVRSSVNPSESQDCYSGLDEDCDGDIAFADTDCGSASTDNLFVNDGSWNAETTPGTGSTGNWTTTSGTAVAVDCTTANTDDCSLEFVGSGTWKVTSDTAATVAGMYCAFSAKSSAASTTITYSFGSSGSQSYAASSLGWGHAVVGPFAQTSAGTVSFTVTIASGSATVHIDSIICQQ